MRKVLFIVVSFLLASTHLVARTPISFCVGYDETVLGGGPKKSPITPPTVYIEDYTLFFTAGHPDYSLTLKDENGGEAYTTVVYSVQTEVTLPASLSGDYELELTYGNWTFTGFVTL